MNQQFLDFTVDLSSDVPAFLDLFTQSSIVNETLFSYPWQSFAFTVIFNFALLTLLLIPTVYLLLFLVDVVTLGHFNFTKFFRR